MYIKEYLLLISNSLSETQLHKKVEFLFVLIRMDSVLKFFTYDIGNFLPRYLI